MIKCISAAQQCICGLFVITEWWNDDDILVYLFIKTDPFLQIKVYF